MIKQAIKSIPGAGRCGGPVASGPGTGGKAREIGVDGSLQLVGFQKIMQDFLFTNGVPHLCGGTGASTSTRR